MRVLPMGPDAVIVEDLAVHPALFAAAVRRALADAVVDVVPAAATVLITAHSHEAMTTVVDRLQQLDASVVDGELEESLVELPVHYDGPDLEEVAAATGLDVERVIELHATARYRVDFCGFAPGFAYLSGLPEPLRLPRRPTPRTRVPAGSVAIAAEYSAVYPAASPGGWHLIGSTTVTMFDPSRTPPALLAPGAAVRFVRQDST